MASESEAYNREHRAHDYACVVRRWRRIARAAKMEMSVIAKSGGYDVMGLRTMAAAAGADVDVHYISAGVHGDEPAAVSGLLEWAEANSGQLKKEPFLIFPCFNPWGLTHNKRENAKGEDLNRMFQKSRHPHIAGWKKFVGRQRIDMAVCLHEDYDALGIYVYRLGDDAVARAEAAMKAASRCIPVDLRKAIDGSKAINGIIQRKRAPRNLPGSPEAVSLLAGQARATMTFETPSEFSLYDRVRTHRAFLEAVFRAGQDN